MSEWYEQLIAATAGIRTRLAVLAGVPILVAVLASVCGASGQWTVFYSVLSLWLLAMAMWGRMKLREWAAGRTAPGRERKRIIAELREMRSFGTRQIEIAQAAEIWAGGTGTKGFHDVSAHTRWLERAIAAGIIETHLERSTGAGGNRQLIAVESLIDFFESDKWREVGRDA